MSSNPPTHANGSMCIGWTKTSLKKAICIVTICGIGMEETLKDLERYLTDSRPALCQKGSPITSHFCFLVPALLDHRPSWGVQLGLLPWRTSLSPVEDLCPCSVRLTHFFSPENSGSLGKMAALLPMATLRRWYGDSLSYCVFKSCVPCTQVRVHAQGG